jgi:hypothetical protein
MNRLLVINLPLGAVQLPVNGSCMNRGGDSSPPMFVQFPIQLQFTPNSSWRMSIMHRVTIHGSDKAFDFVLVRVQEQVEVLARHPAARNKAGPSPPTTPHN